MNKLDPRIKIRTALRRYDFNQSELAKELGVTRAAVTNMKARGEYLPPLQAHRYKVLISHESRQ